MALLSELEESSKNCCQGSTTDAHRIPLYPFEPSMASNSHLSICELLPARGQLCCTHFLAICALSRITRMFFPFIPGEFVFASKFHGFRYYIQNSRRRCTVWYAVAGIFLGFNQKTIRSQWRFSGRRRHRYRRRRICPRPASRFSPCDPLSGLRRGICGHRSCSRRTFPDPGRACRPLSI